MRINSNFNPKPKTIITGHRLLPKSLERRPLRSSLSRKGSLKKSDTSQLSSSFLSLQNYDKKQPIVARPRLSSTKSNGSKGARILSNGRSQSSQKKSSKKAIKRNVDKPRTLTRQESSIERVMNPSPLVVTESKNMSPNNDNKTAFILSIILKYRYLTTIDDKRV